RREDRDRAVARGAPTRPGRHREHSRDRVAVSTALALSVEEFLTWMATERGRSANTVAAYRRDLWAYCAWLDERGIDPLHVDAGKLTEFVGQRRASGAAPASVARQLASI